MKKISFTLQDSSDSWNLLEADLQFENDGEYTVKEETAIALLINKRFPQLLKCNRRIKKLIVVDENNEKYSTNDFDLYGSIHKHDKKDKL